MTDTIPKPIDPMIELTGAQLARVAALSTATTMLIQRRAGLANSTIHPSFAEVIDMAEYIIHGTTVIREYGKGGRLQYNRVAPEPDSVEFDVTYAVVNRGDAEAAA